MYVLKSDKTYVHGIMILQVVPS